LPLYAYRCTQCGHQFEKIQSFSAEAEVACPKCGGLLERPLTAPALQFKGAGWYINDYAPKAASSSSDKSGTDSAPAAAGDAKPATDTKPAAESKPGTSDSASKPAASSSSTSAT
jgi:putative FmdB family regulatory protein